MDQRQLLRSRRRRRRTSFKEMLRYIWVIPAIALLLALPHLVGGEIADVDPPFEASTGPAGMKAGAALRISVPGELGTLDPHQAMTDPELVVAAAITDGLFEYRGPEGVAGLAASSWEFSSGGTVLDITLKSGLRFADGTPCDAGAVVDNLQRIREVGPPVVAGAWLASIREVEALDEANVRIHLWYPDPNLLFTLSRPQMGLVSIGAVERLEEEFEMAPVGLGPFSVSWEVGVEGAGDRSHYTGDYLGGESGLGDPLAEEASVGLEPVEDYHRDSLYLGAITLVTSGPDADPSVLRELDFGLITRVPEGYSAPEGWSVLRRPNLDQHALMYNLSSPVLSDERARRAISAAIDRAAIVEQVFRGDAQFLAPGEVPMTGEEEEPCPGDADLERGRSLLADAGFLAPEASGTVANDEEGVHLVMISDSDPRRVEVSRMMADQIERLGISVELEVLERSDYYERMRDGDYDLSYWVLMPDLVDPLAYTANLRSDSYWNVSQMWKNPELRSLQNEIDDLLMDAGSIYDEEGRRAIMEEFSTLVSENHLYTCLWHTSIRALVRDDVRGIRVPYGHDFRLRGAWMEERN